MGAGGASSNGTKDSGDHPGRSWGGQSLGFGRKMSLSKADGGGKEENHVR